MRYKKISSKALSQNLPTIQKEMQELMDKSKIQKGKGYTLHIAPVNNVQVGEQFLPQQITIDTLEDLLFLIKKEKEWKTFTSITSLLLQSYPQLKDWISHSPHTLIEETAWEGILKVLDYFMNESVPYRYYLRELPIAVDTKFIENHKGVLKSLLDFLLPEEAIDANATDFAPRYRCLYSEPLIRVRILDKQLIAQFSAFGVSDFSIPLGEFNRLDFPCTTVYIIENKASLKNIENFLTLPSQQGAIAIFGKGFGVGALKNAHWLQDKKLYYWGDIDQAGFEILNRVRAYFPTLTSICMDRATFEAHEEAQVTAPRQPYKQLQYLTEEETLFYEYLSAKERENRLEQEKVRQQWLLGRLG
ncbi:DUF3322 and DUF2220 domain-containing protein [Algivirga pacifica]|uniref:DUF3322 and DUF2220 domain-containing protein n=2 Tax=Algivirga pacifica TaxID=1162670 RepID=A0ABP9DFQ0_9BACT